MSPFHSTRPSLIFQSGLGRGQVSRHRLGAVPEPKVAKVKDPLGIEAKQKRLESQLDALKEGKDFDPFQHLTPEQRAQQELHFQEMEKFKTLHSWLDFMFSQSSTYFIFWFALSISALGGSWWFYTKYMIDSDKPRELIALSNPKLQKAIDGVDDEDDKLSMRRKMKLQSNAAEIAQSIAKYNSPNYIESIKKQTHGSVTGSLKNFDPPPASSWESRKPILLAYLNSGYSFPDYVGGGHFHIYHNGKDMVPNILKQIEHDNPGMSFTFQILSPYEMHQMLNQPLYRPRTMKQLDSDAENNVDSSISHSALLALDAVTQAQAQLKSNSNSNSTNENGESKL